MDRASHTLLRRSAKNTTATPVSFQHRASNNPAWAQVNLANGVAGILPAANGGYDGEPVTQITTGSASIPRRSHSGCRGPRCSTATSLTPPAIASQGGLPIHIFDWSSTVTRHTITIAPNGPNDHDSAELHAVFKCRISCGRHALSINHPWWLVYRSVRTSKMVDPTTVNVALAVPTRGSDVGTWGCADQWRYVVLQTAILRCCRGWAHQLQRNAHGASSTDNPVSRPYAGRERYNQVNWCSYSQCSDYASSSRRCCLRQPNEWRVCRDIAGYWDRRSCPDFHRDQDDGL